MPPWPIVLSYGSTMYTTFIIGKHISCTLFYTFFCTLHIVLHILLHIAQKKMEQCFLHAKCARGGEGRNFQ